MGGEALNMAPATVQPVPPFAIFSHGRLCAVTLTPGLWAQTALSSSATTSESVDGALPHPINALITAIGTQTKREAKCARCENAPLRRSALLILVDYAFRVPFEKLIELAGKQGSTEALT